jgi:hypothetical protein
MTSGKLVIVIGKFGIASGKCQLGIGCYTMTTGILIIVIGKFGIASGLCQISSCRIQNVPRHFPSMLKMIRCLISKTVSYATMPCGNIIFPHPFTFQNIPYKGKLIIHSSFL